MSYLPKEAVSYNSEQMGCWGSYMKDSIARIKFSGIKEGSHLCSRGSRAAKMPCIALCLHNYNDSKNRHIQKVLVVRFHNNEITVKEYKELFSKKVLRFLGVHVSEYIDALKKYYEIRGSLYQRKGK